MINKEYITEEIEEVIQGQSYEQENIEYDIFILKTKDNKYILYFAALDLMTKELKFSSMKEFDDLELAQAEYKIIEIR